MIISLSVLLSSFVSLLGRVEFCFVPAWWVFAFCRTCVRVALYGLGNFVIRRRERFGVREDR